MRGKLKSSGKGIFAAGLIICEVENGRINAARRVPRLGSYGRAPLMLYMFA